MFVLDAPMCLIALTVPVHVTQAAMALDESPIESYHAVHFRSWHAWHWCRNKKQGLFTLEPLVFFLHFSSFFFPSITFSRSRDCLISFHSHREYSCQWAKCEHPCNRILVKELK